jgi:hypothetical protein
MIIVPMFRFISMDELRSNELEEFGTHLRECADPESFNTMPIATESYRFALNEEIAGPVPTLSPAIGSNRISSIDVLRGHCSARHSGSQHRRLRQP